MAKQSDCAELEELAYLDEDYTWERPGPKEGDKRVIFMQQVHQVFQSGKWVEE